MMWHKTVMIPLFPLLLSEAALTWGIRTVNPIRWISENPP
jgi:hypothetical protein